MESINKVEIQGTIGYVYKHGHYCRLAVATTMQYKDAAGAAIEETTWFPVTCYKDNTPDFDALEKGDDVYIQGRIRVIKYTNDTDHEATIFEVIPTTLKRL